MPGTRHGQSRWRRKRELRRHRRAIGRRALQERPIPREAGKTELAHQLVTPGAEPVTRRQMIERQMSEPIRPRAIVKPLDIGLFAQHPPETANPGAYVSDMKGEGI